MIRLGTFRRQIILTFVVGFFVLISAFITYRVNSESVDRYRDSREATTGLAQSLAVSSLSWVLANDVAGLQEVVSSFGSYPDLRYAMVLSPTGRVLAHSEERRVGQFVADVDSQALLRAAPGQRVLADDEFGVDVAVPILIDGRHVGWARVSLGRAGIVAGLRQMLWSNILFVLFATTLSLLAAMLLANRLGRRIASLVRVAEDVQAGNFATRARIPGAPDEITRLADSVNQMLDAQARNEERLRAASRYTRSLIEASLDPLVTISADGKITDVNQATEEVTGYGRAELIGTDFSDYFTDPEQARRGYRRVFIEGYVTDYPLEVRHRDGHITDVLYNASVYRNEAGEVEGVFAAARDITERNRAEAMRTQLAAIVESSDDAIIGKTLDNVITSWNHGAEQMYGYTAAEAVGRPIALIVPEDKRQELQEFGERIKRGERVKHGETVRVSKDGRRIEVSLSLSPVFDERGVITHISAIARDITERMRAEELIRKNNQLLEIVFSSIHVMIAYLDRDFNFVKVNKAYAAADQRIPDFFPGRNHFDLYPNEENEAIFRKTVETGEPVIYHAKPFEYAGHPERGVTYWDWRLEPIKGADGRVEGLIFSLLNVTEQTLAMRKVEAASQYARSLIEASLDPLVTISAEGKVTDVNEATERATGRKRAELIGTDFSDYFTEPDRAREGYRQVFLRGYVTDYPLAIRHREGRITEVLYNASVYRDKAGAVLGVFAAARDLTELKKVEKELRELNKDFVTLLENTGDFIYFKDENSRFRFCSQTLAAITGHHSWRDMQGKHDLEVFPEDTARIYYEEELPVFREGRALLNKTDPYYDVQGRRRWVNTNKWPVLGEDGRTVVGIFGISRDITELKEAEDRVSELNRVLEQKVEERTAQLEAANKELEAFSYSVSHDLRTPLRAIDGFSRILLEDYVDRLDAEGRRLLNVVRDNTRRMSQLIDDILQFSRTGRLELSLVEIDMTQLAREVAEELLPADSKSRLEIEALPAARGDRAMMHQVFVNLLSNAIKFSRTREAPAIRVGGAMKGAEAVYYVRDNGVGFDMQYAGKLFGVFQRLHGVTEFEGTGIGLAIVKRIITRHGGRVWAEGRVGEGATFYFALPIKEKDHG